MRLAVNPNRMELLRLKKRVVLARKGHKLLRDKQDELMRRFMSLAKEVKNLREKVEDGLVTTFRTFLRARSAISKKELHEALFIPKEDLELDVITGRIMNITVPKFSLSKVPEPHTYGLLNTPGDLDIALKAFVELLPSMLKLAELEVSIKLLADEIQRTRRRVNALEYVFIPNLMETIKYIGMKLTEIERSNLTRLMRVKEILGSR